MSGIQKSVVIDQIFDFLRLFNESSFDFFKCSLRVVGEDFIFFLEIFIGNGGWFHGFHHGGDGFDGLHFGNLLTTPEIASEVLSGEELFVFFDVLRVDVAFRPVGEIDFFPDSGDVFHLLFESFGVIDLKLFGKFAGFSGEGSFRFFRFLLLLLLRFRLRDLFE